MPVTFGLDVFQTKLAYHQLLPQEQLLWEALWTSQIIVSLNLEPTVVTALV
jgi:hypothetical protein